MYLDPLLRGHYPSDTLADLAEEGITLPVEPGDLAAIATPLDVLGVNYYFTETVRADGAAVRTGPTTALGWPITPAGLTDLLVRLHREYPPIPIVITENGGAFPDEKPADTITTPTSTARGTAADATIDDADRIAFLREHIDAVAQARYQGCDVRGYFVWTLFDNFEWAHGYGPTFGLVSVDRTVQRRTLKRSAHWYRDMIMGHISI